MGNENIVPEDEKDPIAKAAVNEDGSYNPEFFEKANVEAGTSLKDFIHKDEIPNIVGQIASIVKGHFQDQIDGLMAQVGELRQKVDEQDLLIQDLKAEMKKETLFTKDIHKTLYTHKHTLPQGAHTHGNDETG